MIYRRGSPWPEALLAVVVIVLAAITLGLFYGVVPGLAASTLALLGLLLWHLSRLARLLAWLAEPLGAPAPSARGVWGTAFAALQRRARQSGEEQRRLKTMVARFRSAGQALPDGVVVLDSQNAIEWANPTAEKHLGLALAQDRGYAINNLLRDPDFLSYLEAGNFAEALLLRPGRTPGRSLALQVVPYGGAQKLLLSRDISQLEKLETLRRDFVANVSHELKTPLTVVIGFVATLLDGYGDYCAADVEHYLTLVRDQAQRMQRLVDDLLTLSMLETGPSTVDEVIALAGLLREIVAEARSLSAGAHEISLEVAEDAQLRGCRSELRSAIGNLASNAVRYTPPGGSISIAWLMPAERESAGILRVCDDGIGIEAQHLPRLTERFYRVDRGRSRESGGTGLGLAIVKHVLSRHQAVLEIESQPGRGSCFSARFPPQRCRAS